MSLKIKRLVIISLLSTLVGYIFACNADNGKKSGNNTNISAAEKATKAIDKVNDINTLIISINASSSSNELKKVVDDLVSSESIITEAESAIQSLKSQGTNVTKLEQNISSAKLSVKAAKDKVVKLVSNIVDNAHTEIAKQHTLAKAAYDKAESSAERANTKAAKEAADKLSTRVHKYARLLKNLNTEDSAKVIKEANSVKTQAAEIKDFASKATKTYLSALKKNKALTAKETESKVKNVNSLLKKISKLKFAKTYDLSNAKNLEKEIEDAKEAIDNEQNAIEDAEQLLAVFKQIANNADKKTITKHAAALKSAKNQVITTCNAFKAQGSKVAAAFKTIASNNLQVIKTTKDSSTAEAAQKDLEATVEYLKKYEKLTEDIKGPLDSQLNDIHRAFTAAYNATKAYVQEAKDAIAEPTPRKST